MGTAILCDAGQGVFLTIARYQSFGLRSGLQLDLFYPQDNLSQIERQVVRAGFTTAHSVP